MCVCVCMCACVCASVLGIFKVVSLEKRACGPAPLLYNKRIGGADRCFVRCFSMRGRFPPCRLSIHWQGLTKEVTRNALARFAFY